MIDMQPVRFFSVMVVLLLPVSWFIYAHVWPKDVYSDDGIPSWGFALVLQGAAGLTLMLLSRPLDLRIKNAIAKQEKRALLSGRERCAQCGYDLRATRNRCPECGTAPGRGKTSGQ